MAYPDWASPQSKTLITLEPAEPNDRIKLRPLHLVTSAVGLFVLLRLTSSLSRIVTAAIA